MSRAPRVGVWRTLLIVIVVACAGCSSSEPAGPGSDAGLTSDELRTIYAVGLGIGERMQSEGLTPHEIDLAKTGFSAAARHQSAVAFGAENAVAPEPPEFTEDAEENAYLLGGDMAKGIAALDLSADEVALMERAIDDAIAGNPLIDGAEWRAGTGELAGVRQSRALEREMARSQAYLDAAAAEPGAERTSTGLIFTELEPGSGRSPNRQSVVRVNYRGSLMDGTEFDSSYAQGKPYESAVEAVIPCWNEAVRKMQVGGKAKLVCPADLAYGEGGLPPLIPGNAALNFEIELLAIVR